MSDPERTGSARRNPNAVVCVQIPVRDVVATRHEQDWIRPLHLSPGRDGVVP